MINSHLAFSYSFKNIPGEVRLVFHLLEEENADFEAGQIVKAHLHYKSTG
jgi:hypothetical protein